MEFLELSGALQVEGNITKSSIQSCCSKYYSFSCFFCFFCGTKKPPRGIFSRASYILSFVFLTMHCHWLNKISQ